MATRLKDRQKQIPYGYRFYLAEVNWTAPTFASFSTICDGLENVIKANAWLAQKHRWPTTRAGIEDWVDRYNAKVCEQYGWVDYITASGGAELPKTSPPPQPQSRLSRLAAVGVGAKVLVEFLGSKEEAVPVQVSTRRARACADRNGAPCPKNVAGDWLSLFTVPAAEAIKEKLQKRTEMRLETPVDDKLGVCDACDCPLGLKVHIPLDRILKGLSEEQRRNLDPGCWILSEEKEAKNDADHKADPVVSPQAAGGAGTPA